MKKFEIEYYRKSYPSTATMVVKAYTKEGALHKIKKFDREATTIKKAIIL